MTKHCMCGCIYEQAECPNCNKIPDRELIARLRNPKTFDGLPPTSDIKEAADRIEEYAKAFANLQREYDARGERIAELERSLDVAVQTVAESGCLRGQAEARVQRLESAIDYILDGMAITAPDYEIDPDDDFLSDWMRAVLTRLAATLKGDDHE